MDDEMRSKTDTEIMQLLQADDQAALGVVLRERLPSVWPLLKRKFGSSLSDSDLEEVFARALEKLWINRRSFDFGKGDFDGWFYVIARNVALDRLRKEKQKSALRLRLVIEPLIAENENGGHMEQSVKLAISKLSEREREVITPLFAADDVSASELGEKLKISAGAVRALRFRGLQKLRGELAQCGYRISHEKVQL